MDIREKATPPVQEKIARDTYKRVCETVEGVYKDLDSSGFSRNDVDVIGAVRRGLQLVDAFERGR